MYGSTIARFARSAVPTLGAWLTAAVLVAGMTKPVPLHSRGATPEEPRTAQSAAGQAALRLSAKPSQIVPGGTVTVLGADFGIEAGGRKLLLQLAGQPGADIRIPLKVERWSPKEIVVRMPIDIPDRKPGAQILLVSPENRVLGGASIAFASSATPAGQANRPVPGGGREGQVDPRTSVATPNSGAGRGPVPGVSADRGQAGLREELPRSRNPIRKALVLSGGGAKGAFQLGVLKYLYERRRYHPTIITATSVGSLNGAKLAEGPDAFPELERLWRGIEGSQDIYRPNPQVKELQDQIERDIDDIKGDISLLMAGSMTFSWFFYGVDMTYETDPYLLDRWLGRAGQIEYLNIQEGLHGLIDVHIDPRKIADSGIKLSVAMVSRNSGELRYFDGDGGLVSASGAPLDIGGRATIRSGVRASSAIPLFFKPERIGGEDYWDGAIREDIPVRRALQLGATELVIVLCSPRRYRPSPLAGLPSEADIGPVTNTMHAMDIMADQVAQDDLATTLDTLDLLREIGWNALRTDINRVRSFPLPRENQKDLVFTIPSYKVIEPPVVVGGITDFVPEVIEVNIQLGEMVAGFAYAADRNEREERQQVRALIAENERAYRTQYERRERFADHAPDKRQEVARRRVVAAGSARAYRLWKVFEKALRELDGR